MAFSEYIPLKSVTRVERFYPGIYSQLNTMDFKGKREFDEITRITDPVQRSLYMPKVISKVMTADFATACSINDNVFLFITNEWIRSKQVYSFSKEFLDMLCDMDDFDINAEILNYLPFSSFYIEIPESDVFHGVLIRYSKQDKMIYYCICYKDFSNYEGLNGGVLDLNKYHRFSDFARLDCGVARSEEERKDIKMHLHMLGMVFQICMYLCSENSDIVENENQKSIYHPTKTIKNRYSEIRKWDVGYRVMKEYKKAKEKAESDWDDKYRGIRHRPRMHWRKAHWHTYLYGTDRNIRKLKFIAPILVNKIADDELPIVNRAQ